MTTLNDYLYSGETILSILKKYENDLREEAKRTRNPIDLVHCNFLMEYTDLLEHNDFLTSQSMRIKEFYMYMAATYPTLAFILKGRIKSLIRVESKFNGYIVEYIYDYYSQFGRYPSVAEIKERLTAYHDLIAYRIVLCVPKANLKPGEDRREKELQYLYEIANALPEFLEERGFTAEPSGFDVTKVSPLLSEAVRPYYRDYIAEDKPSGYKSLHIAFYDNSARSHIEVQLRTKEMDDFAEIGPANHLSYENRQQEERSRHDLIPEGECPYFDQAYERLSRLQGILLKDVDVNMFSALDDIRVNDSCGLYKGRLILPFEHLSRYQVDSVT